MPVDQYHEPPEELPWRKELKRILFSKGDIVEAGEEAEEAAD